MASFIYDNFILRMGGNGTPSDLHDGTISCMFIDEAIETPDQTNDQDVADRDPSAQVPAFASAPEITTATWTVSSHVGVFDGDDTTFSALTGAGVESLDIFVDTGTDTTSTLISNHDDYTGLAFTPSGGDVIVTWPDTGIIRI